MAITRQLTIETSGRDGSVALFEDGDPASGTAVSWLPTAQRTAQRLAPAIRDLLAQANWPPSEINLVSVTVGPGSFTGLRIGVTTAKAFAYAVGADVLGVSTMDVLAAPVQAEGRLWTILDAQRGELFATLFTRCGGQTWPERGAVEIVKWDRWLQQLEAGDTVTGPVLARLADQLPAGVTAVEESLWMPSAEWAARVAWRAYQQGRRDDAFQLVPHYHRPSAAEEKLGA